MPVTDRRPLMLDILRIVALSDRGVTVRELVRGVQREGLSLNAARAQVSRTIRTLWQQHVVELHGWHWSNTMSARQQRARDVAARASASPEQFYRMAVRICGKDPWGSAAACAAAKAREAAEMPRMYVRRVSYVAGAHAGGELTSRTDTRSSALARGATVATTMEVDRCLRNAQCRS